jgi:lactoylglutathione lyase
MAKIIHCMIRVLDETKSLDFYRTVLGLEIADRYQFDGFTLVYLRNLESNMEIELTVNHEREQPYTHGDGYGHVAVTVDDLDAEHARLTLAGLRPPPIKTLFLKDTLMARFFFLADPDGYKIELIQNHGRYR